MKIRGATKIHLMTLMFGAVMFAASVSASDTDDLQMKLDDFLANVTEADTHNRFWADDLIYTSSNGTRTTKSDIMSGFSSSAGAENDGVPGPVFTAQDVQIQVYGETAVVAFRLVATPPASSESLGIQSYFNTGTFLKRDGQWRAVAWQATIIPD